MEKVLFCNAWQFYRKDQSAKTVDLPHDAMLEQERRADAPSGTAGAFFVGGDYVYEKYFTAPKAWKTQTVIAEFEGVYPKAVVYLNDKKVGSCDYGYKTFFVTLDGLKYDTENVLRVEVPHSQLPDSRWYSGAGIYRPVWLWRGAKRHIKPDSVYVTTLSIQPVEMMIEVRELPADVRAEDIDIEITYKNDVIWQGMAQAVKKNGTVTAVVQIPDARLWDVNQPNLYQCQVTLKDHGQPADCHKTTFGIRKIAWSPDGLSINGSHVKLKGGCIHHDHGILGARCYDQSEWRRVAKLKACGFNAVRSSHNPASRALLEACDGLGMYVMDETWDMWNVAKNPYDHAHDFADGFEDDIECIVKRDYNHPSVIMYSIGNEVTEPGTAEGMEIAGKIKEKFKSLDTTRPLTAGINLTILLMAAMEQKVDDSSAPDTGGMNSMAYNKMVSEMGRRMMMAAVSSKADEIASPVLDLLDIAGYNYASSRYALDKDLHPQRLIIGTETYVQDLPENWQLVEGLPNVIGDFMWTAWDYLGEAGIGSWSYHPEDLGFSKKYPWKLADSGAFDILGNETAEAGMAAVVWDARKTPYIGVKPVNHPENEPIQAIWRGSNALPYWSYQGCEGNPAEVEVYAKAAEIEVFVNGRSLGRQSVNGCKAVFNTVYEPGQLKAVAYDENGQPQAESMLESADAMTQICITPEGETKKGGLLYVDISLTGQNGIVECNRDTKLKVKVDGGRLLAFGSANPRTEESFLSGAYTTYYGRCQAVIEMFAETMTIEVAGDGLETVCKTLKTVHIRSYETKDKIQVQKICVATGFGSGDMDKTQRDVLLSAFCNYYIEEEPQHCFVAETDGQVIGYILCAADSFIWANRFRENYIAKSDNEYVKAVCAGSMGMPLKYGSDYPAHLHIDILPQYQRMGIGVKLVDTLTTHLKENHVKGVMLSVAADNEKGQRFYEKYGFHVLEKQTYEIAMGYPL